MDASGLDAVRVKLYFDYPPPSLPDCRKSWILVDLNKCRFAADLASEIRKKFDYSRKTILDLFIEDCYVPPSESIYLVRDNDSIRVKASSIHWDDAGTVEDHNTVGKKRHREEEEEEEEEEGLSGAPTKKKHMENQVNGCTESNDKSKKKRKKGGKKKKKKRKVNEEEDEEEPVAKLAPRGRVRPSKVQPTKGSEASGSSVSRKRAAPCGKREETSDSSVSSEEVPRCKASPRARAQEAGLAAGDPAASSSSESSCSEDQATPAPGKASVPAKTSHVPPKPTTNSKPATTVHTRWSSSSSSSSESELPLARARPPASTPPAGALSSHAEHSNPSGLSAPVAKDLQKAESSDSDSSSEVELVIRRPNPQAMGLSPARPTQPRGRPAGRGRGHPRGLERGRGHAGGRGGFWKASGTPWKPDFHHNYENEELKKQEDSQTNKSLILQNPAEPKPQRDYSSLPLLAAPPAVGQKIAFKLLELTESYTPEVSDYKEGKITGFNHGSNMIELELLSRAPGRSEPGKFDLVYQNPDGSERVEYAITQGSQLTERWDSLLEPRLIVENAV